MTLGNLAIKESEKDKESNAYDDVPYESFSYPQTHPEKLYTVGKLFKMDPPDFRKARVLELGCAAGGNILPLAILYPDSEYTGIDLSGEQIEQAIRHKDALGLSNIQFKQMDIMDIAKDFGEYDYIIVHGILSWVPQEVADKILDVCRDNLSESGLAVISYNTLPGWNFVKSLREMMLYHCERFEDPKEVIAQARMFLDFLSENAGANQPYKQFIDKERELLSKVNDTYLFHDHLEGNNRQFYFHEFAAMMRERGMQYVGDTSVPSMFVGNLPKGAMEKLKGVNDIVRQEQYMDFINNRRFRTSIICRGGQQINRAINVDQIFGFYLSSSAVPREANAKLADKMSFATSAGGQNFNTNSKPTSALMLEIQNMPARFKMDELIKAAAKKHGIDQEALKAAAKEAGMRLVMAGIINIHSDSPIVAAKLLKKPKAFSLARYQASLPGTQKLTSATGEPVQTDIFNNHIVRYLDGSNDIDSLTGKLADHALAGDISVRKDEDLISEKSQLLEALKPAIEGRLQRFLESGLLVKQGNLK